MTKSESLLEKIFNHWVILAINIVIILFVETTGMFFMSTGLIHLIAIIFLALGGSRIFVHYNVYDSFLKPFIISGIAIIILFTISHIVEYVSYAYFSLPYEVIAANVVNFYIAGLVTISLGVSYFLKKVVKNLAIFNYLAPFVIIACFLAAGIFYMNQQMVEVNASGWLMYLQGGIVLLVTACGIGLLFLLKKHVSMLAQFINYFTIAFILIACSAILYVCNDVLGEIGVMYMQVMYTSHFLFYGAISLMFLAYAHLAHLGGMLEELEKIS